MVTRTNRNGIIDNANSIALQAYEHILGVEHRGWDENMYQLHPADNFEQEEDDNS